jgi:hypothetical protein
MGSFTSSTDLSSQTQRQLSCVTVKSPLRNRTDRFHSLALEFERWLFTVRRQMQASANEHSALVAQRSICELRSELFLACRMDPERHVGQLSPRTGIRFETVHEAPKIGLITKRVKLRIIPNDLQEPPTRSGHLRTDILKVFQRCIGVANDCVRAALLYRTVWLLGSSATARLAHSTARAFTPRYTRVAAPTPRTSAASGRWFRVDSMRINERRAVCLLSST